MLVSVNTSYIAAKWTVDICDRPDAGCMMQRLNL